MNEKRLYGLYGALLGDATGVPFEFSAPCDLKELGANAIDYPFELTKEQWRRSHPHAPKDAWSDDGAQMLALIDSVLEKGKFDLDDFSQKLLTWYKATHYSVDDKLFDIGNQTRVSMRNLLAGQPPDTSGPSQECHNGNGSLMRALGLVIAGIGANGYEDLVNASMDSSMPTHAHVRSMVCCALLNVYGYMLLTNQEAKTEEAFEVVKDVLISQNDQEALKEIELVWQHRETVSFGSPYVVDTLWSSVRCLESATDFKDCIKKAIMMGNDTDTTACIAGGLYGLKYGKKGFALDWLEELPQQRDLVRIEQQLIIDVGVDPQKPKKPF